jgi:hypothetical protein
VLIIVQTSDLKTVKRYRKRSLIGEAKLVDNDFEDRILKIRKGKEIFQKKMKTKVLNLDTTFLLVLTDNELCLNYGVKYLPDFIKLYHKNNVYILLDNEKYSEAFTEAGGKVRVCEENDLQNIAEYLNLFHMKEFPDTRIIFLTEKDGYNPPVGEFLKKGAFTLEEYVAISLYFLKGLREEYNFGSN